MTPKKQHTYTNYLMFVCNLNNLHANYFCQKCVYKSLKIIRVLGNMREKNIYEFKLCITFLWLIFPMTKFNLLDMEFSFNVSLNLMICALTEFDYENWKNTEKEEYVQSYSLNFLKNFGHPNHSFLSPK